MAAWIRTIILPCTALLLIAPLAAAQSLSFSAAQERLQHSSDALMAAQNLRESREALSQASRSLHYPELALDVKYLRFRKTLELPLGSLEPVAQAFNIDSPLEFAIEDSRLRPILSAVVPVYTGGQVQAARKASQAMVHQADAEFVQTRDQLVLQLVQAYFGQQLMQQVRDIRADVRDGLQLHLQQAQKLEQEGFATRAQRLQAQVAADQAIRDYLKADSDYHNAAVALSGLLRTDALVTPQSPLFVISQPLQPLQQFIDAAQEFHPAIVRLQAMEEQGRQAVRAEQAHWQPQLYAFGQYDLYQDDALITDTDWAVGIGLKYTLFSNQNRSQRVSAARHQQYQAEYGLRELQVQLITAITQAYNALDSIRRQFVLTQSSIAQAQENLRLQDLSFQEGQATSLDVIDARLQLGKARIERVAMAYQFDLTLAQLLYASGQSLRFADYLQQADTVIEHD